jgi:hypothetical protein
MRQTGHIKYTPSPPPRGKALNIHGIIGFHEGLAHLSLNGWALNSHPGSREPRSGPDARAERSRAMGEAAVVLEEECEVIADELGEDLAYLSTGVTDDTWKYGTD